MKGITAQAFSLRDEFDKDFEGTLTYLKDHGFTALEPILLFGSDKESLQPAIQGLAEAFGGKIPGCVWMAEEAADRIEAVRAAGLEVESAHLFLTDVYEGLLEEITPEIIEFGIRNRIFHFGVSFMLDGKKKADQYIPRMIAVSASFSDAKMFFAYHNHNMELTEMENGISVLEYVMDAVPKLSLQPDIGWLEAGGGSIGQIMDKYSDRIHSIHFKDMILDPKPEGMNIVCTPIGSGDVNSAEVMPYILRCPLLEHGLVIDQDNARTAMLDELVQGRAYIYNSLMI